MLTSIAGHLYGGFHLSPLTVITGTFPFLWH